MRCAIGRAGISAIKREGDGATPAGKWKILRVLYRADRVSPPGAHLPVQPIRRSDGWCDAPGDRNYNRRVTLPYPAGAECLYRDDTLYDTVVILDYNVRPRARGRGSAIFIHVSRDGLSPTEGCVAMQAPDLNLFLRRCRPGSTLAVLV